MATLILSGEAAIAQSTSSVSGPQVSPGSAIEFRAGAAETNDDTAFSYRLSGAHAITDTLRVRAIAGWQDGESTGPQFSYIEADLLWQFCGREPDAPYKSALRIDVRQDERREQQRIGVNWLNQIDLTPHWRTRLMASVDKEFNSANDDGVTLETRARLSRRLPNDMRLGFDLYSSWGRTENDFSNQRHLGGATLSGPGTVDTNWTVGALAGLSNAAPDAVFQFRLSRSLAN